MRHVFAAVMLMALAACGSTPGNQPKQQPTATCYRSSGNATERRRHHGVAGSGFGRTGEG